MTLRAILSKWQRLLRLTDWDIAIRRMRPAEIADYAAFEGVCWWEAQYKTAEILVNPVNCTDIEATVVHELLHVLLQGCEEQDGVLDIQLEVALNTLSTLLTASCTENQRSTSSSAIAAKSTKSRPKPKQVSPGSSVAAATELSV